jgi:hypothetical protein
MSINYLPNDPLATDDVPMRIHTPRPDRPANRAGFSYTGGASEARYPFGTPEFLYWQCSEAALAAVETWEKLDGSLSRWAQNRSSLSLNQDGGEDLNAYYDRRSLSFFHWTTGSKTTYSGASTDVVAHEAGHALLDAIRPDLWGSFYTEVNAFHEAFGDCIALLTALADRKSREQLIAVSPSLWSENFLEATAEDLSDGIRRAAGAQHPSSAPRHAFNFFEWQLPSSLPSSGPPRVLSSEIHSFGRVFSGCFYDLIGILWNSQPSWSPQALWQAAETAGKLLIAATRSAPETPRFFQAIGRAMFLADEQQFGGANRAAIHEAFAYHNIALGSAAMLAPSAALAGASPRVAAAAGRAATVSAATRRDLLARMGAPAGAKMKVTTAEVGGKRVAQAVVERPVSLQKLDTRLRGVVAIATESVLIGDSASRAAVLGALPESHVTTDEVESFVQTLLTHNSIAFGKKKAAAGASASAGRPTHEVRTVRGKKVLTRIRFACRHCHG